MSDCVYLMLLPLDGLEAYVGILKQIEASGLVEEIAVTLHCEDAGIKDYLKAELGWDGSGPLPAFRDLALALAKGYPPPFRHDDIVCGRIGDDDLPLEYEDLLLQFEEEREKNCIDVTLVVKSPEAMPIAREAFDRYLREVYTPAVLPAAGNKALIPDDFETTHHLLDGEPDMILRRQRTLTLSFPCRDITNSVRLLEVFNELELWDSPQYQAGVDAIMLQADIAEPAYMHLFGLVLTSLGADRSALKIISLSQE